jgi:hypothetical protein
MAKVRKVSKYPPPILPLLTETIVSRDPAEIDSMRDRVAPLVASVVDLVETLIKDKQALFSNQGDMTVD